jgi:hypothetical protein
MLWVIAEKNEATQQEKAIGREWESRKNVIAEYQQEPAITARI